MASFEKCDRCGKTDEIGKLELSAVQTISNGAVKMRLDLCKKCETRLYNAMNKALKPTNWWKRIKKSLRKSNGVRK